MSQWKKNIDVRMACLGLTSSELCKALDISAGRWWSIRNGKGSVRLQRLMGLALALPGEMLAGPSHRVVAFVDVPDYPWLDILSRQLDDVGWSDREDGPNVETQDIPHWSAWKEQNNDDT